MGEGSPTLSPSTPLPTPHLSLVEAPAAKSSRPPPAPDDSFASSLELNELELSVLSQVTSASPRPPLHTLPALLAASPLSSLLRPLSVPLLLRSILLPPTPLPLSPSLAYDDVRGRNCDNCVGYVPLPVGCTSSELSLAVVPTEAYKGANISVPVLAATTEGGLIASLSRGCKALAGANAQVAVLKDGMTRSPCLKFGSLGEAAAFCDFVQGEEGREGLRSSFDSTTSHGKFKSAVPHLVGSLV